MVSQFSDIDAPKREGINTFHVQHGEYPNQKMKNDIYGRMQNKIFYQSYETKGKNKKYK